MSERGLKMPDFQGWGTLLGSPNRHLARWAAIQILYIINWREGVGSDIEDASESLRVRQAQQVLNELEAEADALLAGADDGQRELDVDQFAVIDTYGHLLLARAFYQYRLSDLDREAFDASVAIVRQLTRLPACEPRAIGLVALGSLLSAFSDDEERLTYVAEAVDQWLQALRAGHPRSTDWALANLALFSQPVSDESYAQYRGMLQDGLVDVDADEWIDMAPDDARFRFLNQVTSTWLVRRAPAAVPQATQIAIYRAVEEFSAGNYRQSAARAEYALFLAGPDRPIELSLACALLSACARQLGDYGLAHIWNMRAAVPAWPVGSHAGSPEAAPLWVHLAGFVGEALASVGDPGASRWLGAPALVDRDSPHGEPPTMEGPRLDPPPRFCAYCGSGLTPGARFCSSCGERVAG